MQSKKGVCFSLQQYITELKYVTVGSSDTFLTLESTPFIEKYIEFIMSLKDDFDPRSWEFFLSKQVNHSKDQKLE